MIPIRHSAIFRSRWVALIWAAGIIWFALDVAGRPSDKDADSNSANATEASAGDTGVLNASEFDETARLVRELNGEAAPGR